MVEPSTWQDRSNTLPWCKFLQFGFLEGPVEIFWGPRLIQHASIILHKLLYSISYSIVLYMTVLYCKVCCNMLLEFQGSLVLPLPRCWL